MCGERKFVEEVLLASPYDAFAKVGFFFCEKGDTLLFKTGVAGGIGEFLIRFLKLSCFLFFYKREREKGRDKRREERER